MHSIIKDKARKYFQESVEIRQHLHRYPEVSYQEYETTKYIKQKLDALDIPHESPLETGCVAILEGEKPSDKVIALRADIDALPIHEEGDAKQALSLKMRA